MSSGVAVCTPVRAHRGGLRVPEYRPMPLTPSPRCRAAANSAPITPTRQVRRDPDWQAKKYANAPGVGSLQATLASLSLSASKTTTTRPHPYSPKNDISRPHKSPVHLELGVNDWALPVPKSEKRTKRATRSRPAKQSIRINGDRFIPTRGSNISSTMAFRTKRAGSPESPVWNASPDHFEDRQAPAPDSPESAPREQPQQSDILSNGVFNTANHDPVADENEDTAAAPKSSLEDEEYRRKTAQALGLDFTTRILAFKPEAPEQNKPVNLASEYNRPLRRTHSNQRRRIATAPERVLDAPGIVDNFYSKVLDWSRDGKVAITLDNQLHIWNQHTSESHQLNRNIDVDTISSVRWTDDCNFLAIGVEDGTVQVWDVEEQSRVRTMAAQDSRIGAMAWREAILTSGSRNGLIINHDVRVADHRVEYLESHTGEICGLEWRPDGAQLASGGNDNIVNIWDVRNLEEPKFTKCNHRAAVKALAWSPWQSNLLATGGGTWDKQIHFWNTTTGARVNSIDAGSQVSGIKFNPHARELVTTHGAPDNHFAVWSYPSLQKTGEVPAHDSRILDCALSPDGQTLATIAADENLKFWKVFEKAQKVGGAGVQRESKLTKGMTIR